MHSKMTRARERGVVLVLVLWVLVLLTVMAVTLRANQQTEVALSIGQQQQSQGRALAQGAVNYAIARLLAAEQEELGEITEIESAWMPDGQPNTWQFQGYEITVRVSAERGRINLNLAGADLLRRLMEVVNIPDKEIPKLVGVIQDWRDTNDSAQSPGAEDAEYRLIGKTYGAKDERFSSVRELKLLPGMTNDYYKAMAPALTVYSTKSSVDASMALPLVLEVLDEESEMSDPLKERLHRAPRGFYRLHVKIAFPDHDLYSTEAIVDFNRAYKGGYRIVRWIFNRPIRTAVPVTPG